MTLMKLRERVKHTLAEKGKKGLTIPQLCKEFPEVTNEFQMMHVIAELESSGCVALSGFDKIYREDGGAIYLAKYSGKHP